MDQTNYSRLKGFSLIEVLITTGLFSVLVLIFASAMGLFSRRSANLEGNATAFQASLSGVQLIRRDLRLSFHAEVTPNPDDPDLGDLVILQRYLDGGDVVQTATVRYSRRCEGVSTLCLQRTETRANIARKSIDKNVSIKAWCVSGSPVKDCTPDVMSRIAQFPSPSPGKRVMVIWTWRGPEHAQQREMFLVSDVEGVRQDGTGPRVVVPLAPGN